MGQELAKHGHVKKKPVVVELRGFYKAGASTLFERLVSAETLDTTSNQTDFCCVMTLRENKHIIEIAKDFAGKGVTLKRSTGDVLLHRAPGGRCTLRPILQHRLGAPESHALVFVIDSSVDGEELCEVHSLLTMLVHRLPLQECPFLILANKQDKENALTVECVKERILFDELLRHHKKMGIFGCSALTGEGVDKAMDWLSHELNTSVSTWRGDTYEIGGHGAEDTAKADHRTLLTRFKGTFGSMKRIFTRNTKHS